jgi:hypothetical protein
MRQYCSNATQQQAALFRGEEAQERSAKRRVLNVSNAAVNVSSNAVRSNAVQYCNATQQQAALFRGEGAQERTDRRLERVLQIS